MFMCVYQFSAVSMPMYSVMQMCADFKMSYDVFILCQNGTP